MHMKHVYQKKYGPSKGANVWKAHQQIEQEYNITLDNTTILTLQPKYYTMCKQGNRWKPTFLRVLETLQAPCEYIRKEYDDYLWFSNRFKQYSSKKNIHILYYTCYQPFTSKFDTLSLQQGTIPTNDIQEFISNDTNNCYKIILQILNSHQKYYTCVETTSSTIGDVWSQIKKRCTRTRRRDKKGFQYMCPYSNVQITRTYVKSILSKVSVVNYNVYEQAKRVSLHAHTIIGSHILVLDILGCIHTKKLLEEKTILDRKKEYLEEISRTIKSCRLHDLIIVDSKIPGGIENVHNIPTQSLIECIRTCPSKFLAYTLIHNALQKQNTSVTEFERMCSREYKHQTRALVFKQNEDDKQYIDSIMQHHLQRMKHSSAFVADSHQKLEYKTVVFLEHLKRYGPLKTVFSECTKQMAQSIIYDWGMQCKVKNERVKNTFNQHHAKHNISFAINFFKTHANHLFYHHRDFDTLKTKYFTDRIPNKRKQTKKERRVYLDEEIEAILHYVKDNPMMTLLITILKEIGLRSACLRHLTYNDMFDGLHPKDICHVREKGNVIRSFVSGPNIQKALIEYLTHMCKNNIPQHPYYLFHKKNPQTPMASTTLLHTLKQIGYGAGIQDVNIHPHSFRHTIVGKLMDLGNSSDLVSKFMGHSNPSTTVNHYWLKSTEDIFKDMKHPFFIDNEHEEFVKESNMIYQQSLNKAIYLEKNEEIREALLSLQKDIQTQLQRLQKRRDLTLPGNL